MRCTVPALALLVAQCASAAGAQEVGKPAPKWRVSEVRGAAPTIKLSDYKGKWVAIEFWGYW